MFKTNIVYFEVDGGLAQELVRCLKEQHNVLIGSKWETLKTPVPRWPPMSLCMCTPLPAFTGPYKNRQLRAVTNLDVSREDVDRALRAIRTVMEGLVKG